MLLKVKSKDECLTIARQEYTLKFRRDVADQVSKDELLDYLPDEVFGATFNTFTKYTDEDDTCYYVGNIGWAVDELFVEEITGE